MWRAACLAAVLFGGCGIGAGNSQTSGSSALSGGSDDGKGGGDGSDPGNKGDPGTTDPGKPGTDAKAAEPTRSEGREVVVVLNPGDSKEVVLEVENAFKSTAREVLPLNRAAPPTIVQVPGAPPQPAPRPAQGGAR